MKKAIIVGSGYAGAVSARILAEQNYKVTLLERRPHIAGNMYDELDFNGILVHRYGPHISVMNEKKCFDFLSRFTDWHPYLHRVNAMIDDVEVPLPINLTAIDLLYSTKQALKLKELLIEQYGFGSNVPVLKMRESSIPEINDFAEFIFEKVYLHYTMKMWGIGPDEIDPAVTGRIPIRLSYDNRHFLHKFQVMPVDGFTTLFKNMLDHPNINIKLNTDANSLLTCDTDIGKVFYKGSEFTGSVVYTGALDEWFKFCFGILPYRSLEFSFNTHTENHIQDTTVLNWPDARPQTRRTEMKRLTGQRVDRKITTTVTETPGAYDPSAEQYNEPYYPIVHDECIKQYQQYRDLVSKVKNVYIVGRLAEFKYYNMETTIMQTIKVVEQIIADN